MYITGSNLPFVWFFTESGSSKSGLTPKIQHLFRNGVEFIGASGSATSSLGGGLYRFVLSGSNVNVVGDYEAIAFITGTADMCSLPCRMEVEDIIFLDNILTTVLDIPDELHNSNLELLQTDLTTVSLNNNEVGWFLKKVFSLDDIIEGPLTLRKIIKLIASALFGKSFGGGTANVGFRDTQDTKNRISATVDANGNRTNVTLDGS